MWHYAVAWLCTDNLFQVCNKSEEHIGRTILMTLPCSYYLTVAYLVKKFFRILWKQKVHLYFYKLLLLDSILSYMNPIHIIPPDFKPNLIRSICIYVSQVVLSFSDKFCKHFLSPLCTLYAQYKNCILVSVIMEFRTIFIFESGKFKSEVVIPS